MCLNQCVKGDKQNCEHTVRMILPISVMNSRKKEFLKENFGLTVIFHDGIKFPSFFFYFSLQNKKKFSMARLLTNGNLYTRSDNDLNCEENSVSNQM